ncbi:YutD family protein [Lactobacillus sp.]|uniref:YutD family protein n=1 Tax=Lactobacillus sp. TaxID=1591 RepID=UPI0019A153ED|nr:YutD family protein [Lactobacillus sp.]MBD5429953.1 YutD family protein [Lactobacillus sp.]
MEKQTEKRYTKKNDEDKKKLYHSLAKVYREGNIVTIDNRQYEILDNVKEALDIEILREKYDPYLNQYDYLVGDVSSDHLRLKGFYDATDRAAIDKKANAIVDYLEEYCNPGSPYFVLHLLGQNEVKKIVLGRQNRKKRNNISNKNKKKNYTPHFKERKVHRSRIKKNTFAMKKKKPGQRKQRFVIKKRKG